MTTNGINMPADDEMAECDSEKVVTMMDVLQEQQEFEDDANAVLGASDDKNCTYSKGYVKRQAIYACLTCCPEATKEPTKRAGVCLACSLACHENHDLIELYTKRNFRCDCGNPKFSQPCQFTPNKTDLNYENKYNQNFSGVYCVCKRPYPDPECNEEEEMIQCIICEDWLHTNHLEATVPNNEQYAEMICKDCMEDIDFLHDYSDLVVNVADKEIIVVDPDLDFTTIVKKASPTKETKQETIPNSAADLKANEVVDEPVPNSIDNSVDDSKQAESTADKEMNMSEQVSKPELTEQTDESKTDNNDLKDDNMNEQPTNAEASDNTNSDNKQNNESSAENADNLESTDKVVTGVEPDSASDIATDKVSSAEPDSASATPTDKDVVEPDSVTDAKDAEKAEKTEDKQDAVAEDNTNTTSDIVEKESMEEDGTDQANNTKSNEECGPSNKQEHKRKLSIEDDNETSPKKQKLEEKCTRPKGVKRVYKGSTFWPSNFRQKLCTCSECLAMYKDLAVLFLTDVEDTVTAYEALGKDNDAAASSQYEKGLQALSSLDRIQQINALTEYNKMRDKLLDFLKSFKDRKEIVKEEDIKAFFAGMKPKREPDGVYFCR